MKTELLRVIIILFAVALVIFTVFSAKAKEAKPFKKVNLLYLLVGGLFFGIAGLSAYLGLSTQPIIYFIVLQVLILIIGICHAIFSRNILPWVSKSGFLWEFLFSLIILALGSVFLLLSFALFAKLEEFQFILLSSVTWFLVPLFFMRSIDYYLEIPVKIFKTWKYPIGEKIPDPSDSELAIPVVISFEFQKRVEEPGITNFRAKAPRDMQFGRLFYFFINDYNDRHPEGTIEVADKDKSAFSWVFFHKPKWYVKTKYIDPDESILANQIRENSVVVCHRVNEP
jgi:hypothetical protein